MRRISGGSLWNGKWPDGGGGGGGVAEGLEVVDILACWVVFFESL